MRGTSVLVEVLAALTLLTAGCATPTVVARPGASAADGDDKGLGPLEARAHLSVEAPVAAAGTFTLAGGIVLTAAGDRYEPGWVSVEGGRIIGAGRGAPPTPKGPLIDVAGRYVTPGLIDVHSHLGVIGVGGPSNDVNEATAPVTAGVWAEHGFWPQDPGLEWALRGGVTTIHVLPGSANLIGGRGVTLHLNPARGARAMRLPGAPDSLKMACGENPKRVYGEKRRAPSTRMGSVHGTRKAFAKAQRFSRDQRDKKSDEVARDLELESIAGVLEGRILAQVHCYRADDMLSFLQLAEEFGFRVRAFHHALEAYKIRDVLVAKGVALATWADWWGFKLEMYDAIEQNVAFFSESGGRPVVHSDSSEGVQRLNQEAAKAWHAGRRAGVHVDEDEVLSWVTSNAAWVLGVDDQVGTISPGKRADLVVWDKHPFSVYAKAVRVFVDGHTLYDAEKATSPWSDFVAGQEVGR